MVFFRAVVGVVKVSWLAMAIGVLAAFGTVAAQPLATTAVKKLDVPLPPATGQALAAAFSPDGSKFAVLTGGSLELRDAATNDLIWHRRVGSRTHLSVRSSVLWGNRQTQKFVRFTDSGNYVVSLFCIAQVADGKIRPISIAGQQVLDISCDGTQVLALNDEKTELRLFRLRDSKPGSVLLHLDPKEETEEAAQARVKALRQRSSKAKSKGHLDTLSTYFLPKSRIAVNDGNGLSIYSTTDGRRLHYHECKRARRHLAYVPKKDLLVFDNGYGGMRLMDLKSGRVTVGLGEPKEVYSGEDFATSLNGNLIAQTNSRNGKVHLYDLEQGGWADVLEPDVFSHNVSHRPIAVSPNGRRVVVCETQVDGVGYRLWDVATNRPIGVNRSPQVPFSAIIYAPAGRRLAVKSGKKIWYFYDLPQGRRTGPLRVPGISALSSDGWLLAEQSHGLRLYTTSDGAIAHKTSESRNGDYSYIRAFDRGLTRGIVGSASGKVSLMNIVTGQIKTFEQEKQDRRQQILAISLSPDELTVAAITASKTIELWDMTSRKLTAKLVAPPDPPPPQSPPGLIICYAGTSYHQIEFLGNATRIAARGRGAFDIWDVPSQRLITGLPVNRSEDQSAALFLNDGKYYIQYSKFSIELFEVATNRSCFVRKFDDPRAKDENQHRWWKFISALQPAPDCRSAAIAVTKGHPLWICSLGPPSVTDHPIKPLTPDSANTCWSQLNSDDSSVAYAALWKLVLAGDQGSKHLKQWLTPVVRTETITSEVARQVKALGDEKFRTRQAASAAVVAHGILALDLVKKRLKTTDDAEVKTRLKSIQKVIEDRQLWPSGRALQQVRAISALERIGTQTARDHLTALAKGLPDATLTREAANALVRLAVLPVRDSVVPNLVNP